MRYHALATDYDGTIAHHGKVDSPTVAALKKLVASGRRLVLVTGRELPELLSIFPEISLCEIVVAENGGLLYRPSTGEEIRLADPPSEEFVAALTTAGVGPISVGRTIVATWEPHQHTVLETIRKLGLELQVIFNKGAVMILPAGVNKASGLAAGLKAIGLSPHNAVGVGDAENDHAFLRQCEFSAAVANALPSVKETADVVTPGDHGAGVTELIQMLLADDLATYSGRIVRHLIPLGTSDADAVSLPPCGLNVVICGAAGSGKSVVAARFVQAVNDLGYQFCLIDPDGDYEPLKGNVVFGSATAAPVFDEILHLLEDPMASAVVRLNGLPIGERPQFFQKLLPLLLRKRAQTGRPHWILLDEAHHLLPADWKPPAGVSAAQLVDLALVTVHPQLLSSAVIANVQAVIAVGAEAGVSLSDFAHRAQVVIDVDRAAGARSGEMLLWTHAAGPNVRRVSPPIVRTDKRPHQRKYTQGELPPDRSFYFRGAERKLNLRAQNLPLFLQIADGVDDETWLYHFAQDDYSRWLREGLKDNDLADVVARIERLSDVGAERGRRLIREAIEQAYALPSAAAE